MTDEALTLAGEFPPATEAEWRKLVEMALKGASFDKHLVSQTYDGLRVEPLYPRAAGAKPVAGRKPGAPWTVMQRIDHSDPKAANAQALEDLESGATGLTLVFAGSLNANGYGLDATPETLARVLDGVALDAGITINFDVSGATCGTVSHFAELVKKRGLQPSAVDMRAGINPIGRFAASGASLQPWRVLIHHFAELIAALVKQGFRGPFATADCRIIHNAGGSEVQELSFALASALEYLRALLTNGVPLDAARTLIYFHLAADADEFLTIAKFRAIRKLWARIEQACGLAPKPAVVAGETAWRMMTKYDPYVNMLRTTIAVAAAGLGGADNIAVMPHTAAIGLPDAFARRVARNTQLVLLEESNLAKVADPAAGSGAIEDLTSKLCAAAWSQFQAIDKAGGVWAALEQGLIQREVAAVREKRQAAAARRMDAITGTSDYPNLHEDAARVLEVAHVTLPKESGAVSTPELLPSIRFAEPFEALRDASDRALKQIGARPKVFLANLGTPSDFTARATFAKNFYEAGGIEAVTNDGFKNSGDMVAAFKASGAKLACICSSDKVYERQVAAATKVLTAAGAIVQLAGRPGENEANWRQAGVKTFVFTGCDALSTLREAHGILQLK